ncbi:SRR1-like protein [Chionoecetes opilio]|uniref:SRR1-like protein n=1 Tax=Chionoecetes opilio TaxID=41210 RepID=A0A8J4YM63_CHIOP|nr:SRR1-like protein [Chionoecetes opilio]
MRLIQRSSSPCLRESHVNCSGLKINEALRHKLHLHLRLAQTALVGKPGYFTALHQGECGGIDRYSPLPAPRTKNTTYTLTMFRRIQEAREVIQTSEGHVNLNRNLNSIERELKAILTPHQSDKICGIVCYGLGQLSCSRIARYQCALLLILQDHFQAPTEVYDPAFSVVDAEVLEDLSINVLNRNEEGKRRVVGTTLFFLPHCGKELNNNLLWANWNASSLPLCVIVGNSFSAIVQNVPTRILKEHYRFIYHAQDMFRELPLTALVDCDDVFNDMSIHIPCHRMLHKCSEFWSVCSYGCNHGSFIVGTMTECHPWLTCDDIRHLDIGELIGFGAVKHVYQTSWQSITMAIAFLNNKEYKEDFLYGIKILKQIGSRRHVIQLLGFCEEAPVVLTEYHPLGSSLNVEKIVRDTDNTHNLRHRFQLCIDYVEY